MTQSKEEYKRKRRIYSKKYAKEYPDAGRIRVKRYQRKLREQVLAHYGHKCVCCGEDTYEFLAIDHIDGGGNKHRKEVGYGATFYLWVIKNNFPKGLQVLCHNCNLAKGYYKICPHEKQNAV